MLGYVQIYKADLKIREYEIYCGYYCGICKYIGQSYGQLPRMTLSYDAAFLAVLLASVSDNQDEPSQERCIAHHIKKKTVIRNDAIEYAGDLMLLLAWYKFQDDICDENKKSARARALLFKGIYRKLKRKHPSLCGGISKHLESLARLEKEKCASLDQAAEDFAKIMELIFLEGSRYLYGHASEKKNGTESENRMCDNLHETFAKVGYHMGKWIYLIDAVDDIVDNIESGAYNPLLYRFDYRGAVSGDLSLSDETPDRFGKRIRDRVEFNLFQHLTIIGESLENLDIKKNQGIIDNVVYLGLNRQTRRIIDGSL